MLKISYGWGINDSMVPVSSWVDGKRIVDPYYKRWASLLERCYSHKYKANRPAYDGVYCSEKWKYLSDFKMWADEQPYWQSLSLDKDLLVKGNKEYGPDTCAFVPQYLNSVLQVQNNNGSYLLGVAKTPIGKYKAQIKVDGEPKHLGHYSTMYEAHAVWQVAKAYAIECAVTRYAKEPWFRTDVADALMSRIWELRLNHAQGVVTTEL